MAASTSARTLLRCRVIGVLDQIGEVGEDRDRLGHERGGLLGGPHLLHDRARVPDDLVRVLIGRPLLGLAVEPLRK